MSKQSRMTIVLILMLVLIQSCSTISDTRIYSINVTHDGFGERPVIPIYVGILTDGPPYLKQPYAAYRNSPYELTIAKYSKWDSPPVKIISTIVRERLSDMAVFSDLRVLKFIPSNYYSLRLELKRFERHDLDDGTFGEIILDVSLHDPSGKPIYIATINEKVKLKDRSFLALAKTLSGLLETKLDDVCKGLVTAATTASKSDREHN